MTPQEEQATAYILLIFTVILPFIVWFIFPLIVTQRIITQAPAIPMQITQNY